MPTSSLPPAPAAATAPRPSALSGAPLSLPCAASGCAASWPAPKKPSGPGLLHTCMSATHLFASARLKCVRGHCLCDCVPVHVQTRACSLPVSQTAPLSRCTPVCLARCWCALVQWAAGGMVGKQVGCGPRFSHRATQVRRVSPCCPCWHPTPTLTPTPHPCHIRTPPPTHTQKKNFLAHTSPGIKQTQKDLSKRL